MRNLVLVTTYRGMFGLESRGLHVEKVVMAGR